MKEKVAIVTGASRGIGAATARALAEQGVSVMLVARNVEACEAIAAEIRKSGGQARALCCDISNFDQVTATVAQTLAAFGRLDILINNAGVIEPITSLRDADPKAWADSISINLSGAYFMVKAVLAGFDDDAVIVNVSSGAAHAPREGWSAYCAGKAGMAMLTRSIALEIPAEDVRVYGFAPGTVDTEMQATIRDSGINPISQMKREDHRQAGIPATIIAWLCSEEAKDLAGEELSINDDTLRRRAGA
ncbi:MAG: SDR family NAD(P)-dependent oxidoreductase [Alphaproteobacteria bacterium]